MSGGEGETGGAGTEGSGDGVAADRGVPRRSLGTRGRRQDNATVIDRRYIGRMTEFGNEGEAMELRGQLRSQIEFGNEGEVSPHECGDTLHSGYRPPLQN